jgi:23S rRNA pseudouridine2605 synthase
MDDTLIRLDKHLSNLGVCSRRDVKQLLMKQTVTINGKRVRESGARVDASRDDVRLNGAKIREKKLIYFILNKPKGIISTTSDEFDRKNVTSLIPTRERIYPVGRLDKDTTGLIILTNDGDLTNKLIHPRYHIFKVYHLTIEGLVNPAQMKALRTGVLLDDGITAPAKVRVIKQQRHITNLEITLYEGRNRQIRRMCETVGLRLSDLKRVQFGPIHIGNLLKGAYRELTAAEIETLRKLSNQNAGPK